MSCAVQWFCTQVWFPPKSRRISQKEERTKPPLQDLYSFICGTFELWFCRKYHILWASRSYWNIGLDVAKSKSTIGEQARGFATVGLRQSFSAELPKAATQVQSSLECVSSENKPSSVMRSSCWLSVSRLFCERCRKSNTMRVSCIMHCWLLIKNTTLDET